MHLAETPKQTEEGRKLYEGQRDGFRCALRETVGVEKMQAVCFPARVTIRRSHSVGGLKIN